MISNGARAACYPLEIYFKFNLRHVSCCCAKTFFFPTFLVLAHLTLIGRFISLQGLGFYIGGSASFVSGNSGIDIFGDSLSHAPL